MNRSKWDDNNKENENKMYQILKLTFARNRPFMQRLETDVNRRHHKIP